MRRFLTCLPFVIALVVLPSPFRAQAAEIPDLSDTYHDVNEIHDQLFPLPNPNEFRCRGLAPVANRCWKEFDRTPANEYRVDVLPGGTFVGVIDAVVTDSKGNVAHKRCQYTAFVGSCETLSHPDLADGHFRIDGTATAAPGFPVPEGEFVAIIEFAPPT